MGFKASDVIISTIFAFLSAILASFLFRLDWFWILLLTLIFDLLFLYLLRNEAKNEFKLSEHPDVFSNPMGSGDRWRVDALAVAERARADGPAQE